MQKFLISLSIIFLFLGCSQKAPVLKHNGVKEQALVDSRTIQLTQGKEILAFVVVTYLNLVDEKYRKDDLDKFIVGVYSAQKYSNTAEKIKFSLYNNVPNPEEISKDYLNKHDVNTTTEAENLIVRNADTRVQALDINDSRLEAIPSSNIWNKYFLVSTKRALARTITLSLDSVDGEFVGKKITFTKRYF